MIESIEDELETDNMSHLIENWIGSITTAMCICMYEADTTGRTDGCLGPLRHKILRNNSKKATNGHRCRSKSIGFEDCMAP